MTERESEGERRRERERGKERVREEYIKREKGRGGRVCPCVCE